MLYFPESRRTTRFDCGFSHCMYSYDIKVKRVTLLFYIVLMSHCPCIVAVLYFIPHGIGCFDFHISYQLRLTLENDLFFDD